MTTPAMSGTSAVVIDDTALLALGAGSQMMSRLIAQAHAREGRMVLAPAMCVAAAVAQRPPLGDHIGSLDAIHVLDLTFAEARAAGAAIAAGTDWRRAHALAAAYPSLEWPAGLPVITSSPEPYRTSGLHTIELT